MSMETRTFIEKLCDSINYSGQPQTRSESIDSQNLTAELPPAAQPRGEINTYEGRVNIVSDNELHIEFGRGIVFILKACEWGTVYWYCQKNGESVSRYFANRAKRFDDIVRSVRHLLDDIHDGKYYGKKTESERIKEIVSRRGLTSCMNDTKWRELVHALNEEMPLPLLHGYKTLFQEKGDDQAFLYPQGEDSFNNHDFKAIEWVCIDPVYRERKHIGRLVDDEVKAVNLEKEFLALMKKYSIECEYDIERGEYMIYGYK